MRGEISMACTVFTLSSMIKGGVCWYCFDVHQLVDHGQQCTIMYKL